MASTRDMIFNVSTLIAFISSVMTLEPGDIILTGTPAGVGELKNGDVVDVEIEGLGKLSNPVKM
jgi:2-keto-4-pentenoate hydratase/2-oxohepta-3-ene-1,7-dioic acid hydratase in catechol pathway